MGKGDAKARARRHRAKWSGVALARTPAREKSGRAQREPMQHIDGAVDALTVRCRRMGWPVDDLSSARSQSLEGPMGELLNAECQPDEIERLWPVWTALDGARARYVRHFLGIRRHAATMRLEMLADRVETSPDARVDLRSDEEKANAAATSWAHWLAGIKAAGAGVLRDVQRSSVPLTDRGRATPRGIRALDALRNLARTTNG